MTPPVGWRILPLKLRAVGEQLGYLIPSFRVIWAASRWLTVVELVVLAVLALAPAALVHLTKDFVDSLAAAAGDAAVGPELVTSGTAIAAVLLLGIILRSAAGWIRSAQTELLGDHMTRLIHGKSIAVDLAFYESADYYDHLHRAREEARYRPAALLDSFAGLFHSTIGLAAIAFVVLPYGAWVIAAAAAAALPAFFAVVRYGISQHDWRMRTTGAERRAWDYDSVLTDRANAAETRLFNLGPHFRLLHTGLRDALRREWLLLAKTGAFWEVTAEIFALAITGGVLAWMTWQAVLGAGSLGTVALFYQAFDQGRGLIQSLLRAIGGFYTNSLFLKNFFTFLALEPTVTGPADALPGPRRLTQGIRFDNVTFRYPGTSRKALDGFTLYIPAGRTTALLGKNGSGKTSLVKLLCRFYDPDEGVITLDGIDLRSLRPEDVRRLIAVLFQDPVRYNATVEENIALGDLSRLPEKARVRAAAERAGVDLIVRRLPENYDTVLGTQFDGGTDLSCGEWQRVALARALVRPAPVVILDEPTSAMDPWSEAAWLERFGNRSAAAQTAIVITHRFTTAMRADEIHVLENGRVVESGSHEALLRLGNRYAALVNTNGGEAATELVS